MRRTAALLVALLLPGAAAAAPVHAQRQLVVAPERGAGDRFGAAIAVDGALAVITAPGRGVSFAGDAGVAYVLLRTGTSWSVIDTLEESGSVSLNRSYGASAAMADGLLVVGAPGSNGDAGSAYVYRHDANLGWQLASVVASPMAALGGRFGVAVGTSGAQVLVGETVEDLPPDDSKVGRVHVYGEAVAWSATQTLQPLDSSGGDRFGVALAVDGDVAVVGAPGKEGARGAAYVYTREAGAWTQAQKLVIAGERVVDDFFGSGVAVAGDRMLIGAHGRHGRLGAAYVFVRQGGAWTQTQELGAESPASGELFGARVALTASHALITGQGFESVADIGARGGAYLFGLEGGEYGLRAALRADDGVPGDQLGLGAALSDDDALLGAPFDDAPANPEPELGQAPGSAYVFGLEQAIGEPCASDSDCPDKALCCEMVCVAAPSCGGIDPTTGPPASTGEASETTEDPVSTTSDDAGPPQVQYEPGDDGCGCRSNEHANDFAGLALLMLLVMRRRRTGRAAIGGVEVLNGGATFCAAVSTPEHDDEQVQRSTDARSGPRSDRSRRLGGLLHRGAGPRVG